LLEYSRTLNIEPEPAKHHLALIDLLQKLSDGEIRNAMVFEPPGSAKSTYASILAPSHCLGRFAGQKGIFGSYDTGLATQFGRKVRNLTEQDQYKRIFPGAGLTADSKAKGEWELENGSSYFACGVGGAVTGRRGDWGIIDDPVKGRKDAESETVQASIWDWYENDFTTRLKPEAWKLIIQTRWHLNDLSGKILPDDWDGESGMIDCGDHGEWYVLCIPAEARENDPIGRKPGEWLWPEWFTPEYWERTKRSKSARVWNSLYQQRPVISEGTFFKRESFWRFDPKDAPERKYMTGDFAVTDDLDADDPDFTSLGIHGIDQGGDGMARIYLCADGWRGKRSVTTDPSQARQGGWINQYFRLVRKHKPMCEFAEVGIIRRAIEGMMTRKRRELKAYGRIEWISHIGDKVANARALQDLSEMGQVGIATGEFGDAILENLIKFPAGRHDDDVDMCALMARVIDEAHPRVISAPKTEKKTDKWNKAFSKNSENDSWRI
jgi:hypothetical protein